MNVDHAKTMCTTNMNENSNADCHAWNLSKSTVSVFPSALTQPLRSERKEKTTYLT